MSPGIEESSKVTMHPLIPRDQFVGEGQALRFENTMGRFSL